MSSLHHDAYNLAMAGYRSALIEQEHAYRQAELVGDAHAMAQAHQEIASLRAQQKEAHEVAVQHAAAMRQPQRHPSGLTESEIEIAKASHSFGAPEERIEDYRRNKAKYQHMRATGEYRDDQGTVTR
jgi:hypothetical protein